MPRKQKLSLDSLGVETFETTQSGGPLNWDGGTRTYGDEYVCYSGWYGGGGTSCCSLPPHCASGTVTSRPAV